MIRKWSTAGILCALVVILCLSSASALSEDDPAGNVPRTLSGGDAALSDETSLGRAVADALVYASGAQIAVVNGGDLGNSLGAGVQTRSAARAALSQDRETAVAQVTPKMLRAILEVGVSHIIVNRDNSVLEHDQSQFDGFPQVSGFWFQYDAAAPVGERVMRIEVEGVGAVDLEDDATQLTMAASAYMLSGGYGYPQAEDVTALDMTLSDALIRYITSGQGTGMGTGSNMSVAGSRDNSIISIVPSWLLPAVVVIFVVGGIMRGVRKSRIEGKHRDRYDM